MLAKLTNAVVQKKVRSLLERYQVELLHHTPGRARVRIQNWRENRSLLLRLIEDIQADPAIVSVAFTEETGSILIYYKQESLKAPETFGRWQALFNKYFGS